METKTFSECCGAEMSGIDQDAMMCPDCKDHCVGEEVEDEGKTLRQEALELCWEIEKLPASEQQTKISVMASALRRRLVES